MRDPITSFHTKDCTISASVHLDPEFGPEVVLTCHENGRLIWSQSLDAAAVGKMNSLMESARELAMKALVNR